MRPLLECCGCGVEDAAERDAKAAVAVAANVTDSSNPEACLPLPFCNATADNEWLTWRSPAAVNRTAVPSTDGVARAQLAAEANCSWSLVRESLPLELRAAGGVASPLRHLRSYLRVGSYSGNATRATDGADGGAASIDRAREIRAEYEALVKSELLPRVYAFNDESARLGDGVTVAAWGGGETFIEDQIVRGLIGCMYWAAAGAAAMLLYMVAHTRSLVLSVAALGCVVLSFPTTWFVYAGIYRIHFMGIFNFIALFVIVGIGVDDVFVFHDAWKQAAALHPDDLEARLGYAYRRSVSAMAVTTVMDAAAFFTNCLSSITVVRVFGVFMGTLVLINFALVVTLFPAIVVLHHKWSARRRDRGDAKSAAAAANGDRISPRAAPLPSPRLDAIPGDGAPDIAPDDVTPAVADAPAAAAPPPLRRGPSVIGASWTQRVERFLAGPYLRVLLWLRPVVFVGAAALLGGAAYSMTQLTPSDRDFTYETFHNDTNLMRAINQFEEAWGGVETDSPWLDVVWGVDGLDRAASDPNDPFDEGGAPMYSSPFEPSSAEAQLAVLRVCEGGAAVGSIEGGRHRCFMEHVRDWQEALGRPFPIPAAEFEGALGTFSMLSKLHDASAAIGESACDTLRPPPPPPNSPPKSDYVPGLGVRPAAELAQGSAPHPPPPPAAWHAVTGEGFEEECRAFFGTAAAHRDGKVWALGWAAHLRWSCPGEELIIELNADGSTADASYTADLTHRWCHCLDADDALNAANEVAKIGGLGAPGDDDSMSEEERAAAFSRKPGDYAGACPSERLAPPSPWAGYAPRLRALSVRFRLRVSYFASAALLRPIFDEFEALLSEANGMAAHFTAVSTHDSWTQMRTEEVMLTAALHGCVIAVGLGGAVLVLCLGNWLVALLAIAHVCFVIACSIAAMVWFGWQVGFIEACMINLVAGFSVDFVAHLAIAYNHAPADGGRRARTQQALGELGVSIAAGGFSTILASLFLAAAPLIPFSKLGGFMIANIFFSALTAMVVLPASLATVGPPLRIGGATLTGELPRPWRRRGDAGQQPSPRPTEPSKVAPVFEVEA